MSSTDGVSMEYIAVKVRVPRIGFSHKEFRKLGSFVELRKGRRNRSPKQRETPKEDAATLGSKKTKKLLTGSKESQGLDNERHFRCSLHQFVSLRSCGSSTPRAKRS